MKSVFSKNNPAEQIQMGAHLVAPKVERNFDPLSVAVVDADSFARLMNATEKRQRKAAKRAELGVK